MRIPAATLNIICNQQLQTDWRVELESFPQQSYTISMASANRAHSTLLIYEATQRYVKWATLFAPAFYI